MSNPNRQQANRRGAVTVEFALTAPVLFLFVFAGIEFSRANMLIHTASIAATEGARRGIIAGATAESCYQAAQDELVAVGIDQASIVVQPGTIDESTQMITVGVRVPLGLGNGYVTPKFFLGKEVVRTVSITREAKDTEGSAEQAEKLNNQAASDLIDGGGEPAGRKKEKGLGKDRGKGKGKGKGKK